MGQKELIKFSAVERKMHRRNIKKALWLSKVL